MADTFIQLPADGPGKRVRSFTTDVAGVTVHHQASVSVDAHGNEHGVYTNVVDEVSPTLIYVGYAAPGTGTSTAAWRVKRVQVIGTETITSWAQGNSNFGNVWADRLTLPYS